MISTVLLMSGGWPHQEFGDYLRALMTAAGIADFAELSRLTGLNQSLFSNWRRGLAKPSHASLRKVAPALDVSPVALYMAAGLATTDEMDLSRHVDLTVLPKEIREFVDLYLDARLSDEQRSYARRAVAHLTAGLRAEMARSQVKPSGRRRAG